MVALETGYIGFTHPNIDQIAKIFFGNSLWNFAPDKTNEYRLDYTIQY
jgi:hypothetical protein